MKKLLLSAAALTLLFTACKKDDDNNTSRKDMLVGTWKLSETGSDANANSTLDAGETTPTIDSLFTSKATFNSNGTGSATTIYTLFGTTDTVVSNFQWSLLNNEQSIRLIDVTDTTDIDTSIATINTLTNSKFVVLSTDTSRTWTVFMKQ